MRALERLAEWYLRRRGRVVLPRAFVGLAIGSGVALKRQDGLWTVAVHERGQMIALNGSTIDNAFEGG